MVTNLSNPLAATAKNRRWVLFWIVWSFLLSAVYGILGSDSYLRIRDAADSDFSNQIIAAKDFLAHGFTFWNPHLGGGLASWMSQQVDSLFLTVPFLFLPPWAAYALIMGLQRFVAGYFCYRLFLRLNIGQIASLFGGILFSLNSWNVDDWTLSDGFGPPATPLYLYLFDRLLDLPSKKLALALSGCLGILIGIGGSAAHFTPFFLVFLPLWFLIVRRVSILKTWPFFISLTIGAILAEGPESWALYSFSLDSTRILIPPSTDSGFPSLLAQTKDYFSHILAIPMWGFLVVALAGFFLHGKNDGLFKKALILFALFLLFQPVSSWSFFLLSLKMPYTGGNIMDLRQFSFFSSVLVTALGLRLILHALQESTTLTLIWKTRLAVFVPAVFIIPALFAWNNLTVNLARRTHSDNYRVLFENSALKELAATTKNDKPFRVASLVASRPTTASASGYHFFPNYSATYGFQTIDGFYHMYSQRLYQYWLRVVSGIVTERPELQEDMKFLQFLYTPRSHGFDRDQAMIPVANPAPIEFADWYNLDMLSLANTRFIFSHWPLRHPDLELLHDPVAERKVRQQWEQYRKREMVLKVIQGEPPPQALYVYENRAVLPRAFLVGQVQAFPDPTSLLNTLATRSSAELARIALVEQGELADISRYASPIAPTIVDVSYPRPDRVIIKSAAKTPSILVLTDNYDPHWRVRVDGMEKKIFPVYHLYRGVELEQGNHEITMEYEPTPWVRILLPQW